MVMEKGVISSSQLLFLAIGFVQGATLTVAFVTTVTKQDTWLVVLSGLLVSFLVVFMYLFLAAKFPGKNLIQINDCAFGPYLGKLISTFYLLFFFLLIPANLRFVGDFFLTYIMPETPMLALIVLFVSICAFAVRKGIEVIARVTLFLVVADVMMRVILFILLLKDMKVANFLPFMELTFMDFIQGTNIMVTIPYCEVLVFLMIIPIVNLQKQVKMALLMGLTMGGASLLLITFMFTAVMGLSVTILTSPTLEAVRYISIAKIITRMEMLVAIGIMISMFIKVNIIYYALVLGIAQTLKLRSYLPLVIPLGILCISTTILMYSSSVEETYNGANIWPIWAIPFEIFLPVLTLLVVKMRGLGQKKLPGYEE